jgi:hypothetical protein
MYKIRKEKLQLSLFKGFRIVYLKSVKNLQTTTDTVSIFQKVINTCGNRHSPKHYTHYVKETKPKNLCNVWSHLDKILEQKRLYKGEKYEAILL